MSRDGRVQQRAPVLSGSDGTGRATECGATDFTRPPLEGVPAAWEDVLWVPCEHIHLARISLPLSSHAGRLKALPFAFEPLLAEPLDNVHVALGPALAGTDYVAAALSRQVMQAFAERAGKTAKLVPDVLMLPIPPPETWHAGEIARRVLVRTPDGAGFACSKEAFGAFHEAAGRPVCRLMFGSADELSGRLSAPALGWPIQAALLDLRQGDFSAGKKAEGSRARLQMQLAAATLATFTFALGAEAWILQGAADQQRARLSAELAARFPGLPQTEGAPETIERLSGGLNEAGDKELITILSAAAAALEPGGGTALQRAEFSARESRLTLSLETGSVEALYDYVGRLETAGLPASVENVEAIAGGAEGLVSISAMGGLP